MFSIKYMIQRGFLTTILAGCFISIQPVCGQFVTKKLETLAKATGVSFSDTLFDDNRHDYDSVFFYRKHPLHIKTNNQGEICHFGYSLFPAQKRDASLSNIYDFMERYLLELDLLESWEKRQWRLKIDNVLCSGDPTKMIMSSSYDESVVINADINHKYLVDWQRGQQRLTMTFDAYYQLLLGADDIELEEIAWRKIKKNASQKNYTGDFKLIFDRYGYVKDTINFSRQDVISLIEEECQDKSLQQKNETDDVLFAINHEFGFVHMASFKPGEAKLLLYVPIHDAPDSFINQLVPPKQQTAIISLGEEPVTSKNPNNQTIDPRNKPKGFWTFIEDIIKKIVYEKNFIHY